MATGTESLHHLRKMKRRLAGSNTDRPMEEKFDLLEKTLNVFRSEVDMKLKIMHQILTTRNEQVAVHKKLLDREQILYDTLLGHWKNSANLAATGVTVNFSADDIFEGYNDENNSQSDPDYIVGDEPVAGPSRKKSKSSLRRERNSAKSTRGQLPVQNAAHPGSSHDAFGNQDPLANPDHDGTSTEEWNAEAVDPREQVNVKCETRQANTGGTIEDGESENNFDRTYGYPTGVATFDNDNSVVDEFGNPIGADLEMEACLGMTPEVEDHGVTKPKLKRRRVAKPDEWNRNLNRERRMKGQEYTGRHQEVKVQEFNEDGTPVIIKQHLSKVKKARCLGPRCDSAYCQQSRVNKCKEIDDGIRQEIFNKFWMEMDWSQKKAYMCSIVKRMHTKQQTVAYPSRRTSTLVYYLNVRGTYLKVCKTMFLSTFGIGISQVYRWVKRANPL